MKIAALIRLLGPDEKARAVQSLVDTTNPSFVLKEVHNFMMNHPDRTHEWRLAARDILEMAHRLEGDGM